MRRVEESARTYLTGKVAARWRLMLRKCMCPGIDGSKMLRLAVYGQARAGDGHRNKEIRIFVHNFRGAFY